MAVDYERSKLHASTHVCKSPVRQRKAAAGVRGITGDGGVLRACAEAGAASTDKEAGE
jgi:hypothetical protein